jgi:hypothetical protein
MHKPARNEANHTINDRPFETFILGMFFCGSSQNEDSKQSFV